MRRTAALLALAAGLVVVPAASASACAPPAEGEPTNCCPGRELLSVTVGDHTVVVHDPSRPQYWCP